MATISREGFAAIHDIPLNFDKFSWTQDSLPIRHGGLGIIPASSIAEAAYAGCVIDTSDLASKLTTGIKEKHPYRLEEMILEEIERTQLQPYRTSRPQIPRIETNAAIFVPGNTRRAIGSTFLLSKKARRSAEGSSTFVSGNGSK